MSKRMIVRKKEMEKMRAANWEFHYANRRLANCFAEEDRRRVERMIVREVPEPEMLMNGALLDGMAELRGTNLVLIYLNMINTNRFMFCVWYWSEEAWMELVRSFQRLPEIYCDYYYLYDAVKDAVRYEPMIGAVDWEKNKQSLKEYGERRKKEEKQEKQSVIEEHIFHGKKIGYKLVGGNTGELRGKPRGTGGET